MNVVSESKHPEESFVLSNSWEEKGIEKGIEQGREQGVEQAKKEMVLEMLKEKIPVELIMKVSHLSLEEVEAIAEKRSFGA